jgi:hypothetical protein
MIKQPILNNLKQLNQNTYERNGFNAVVDTVYKIARNYVFYNKSKVPNFSGNVSDLQDLAIDAISSLFIKNGNGKYPICKSFEEWNPSIRNEEDALFFLNKLTANRVEQHISKCLKEADPVFSKILDTLNYAIKKYDYKKCRILGQVFILKNDTVNLQIKTFSFEDLRNVPSNSFQSIDKVFEKLFKHFADDGGVDVAIPLNALAIRIKNIQSFIQKNNVDSNTIESTIYLNDIVQEGYNAAVHKLNESYYNKGKLSKSETEIFSLTLQDISKDILNGTMSNGLYKYFQNNMNIISKEDYQLQYHNVLEYLLKVMKNSIKIELEKRD